jgi:predicted dehydrogenase/threonine dehydrogenase-like Zn-dependent dehydrogenase
VKQILQSLRSGSTEVALVPRPANRPGHLLIETSRTLVSAGTERSLLEFGKAGLIDKALQQPDKVRMVIEKIKTDGLMPTLESVFNKLDQPLPLGYCNVGVVLETGGVAGFKVGDRVVSNGKHAEVVSVPANLCAKVPETVSEDDAAFAVAAAIGLQGIRLAQPTLGEAVVVTGLGLIGLLTVQLLRAAGCRVLGIDFDEARLALCAQLGGEVVHLGKGQDPVTIAEQFSRGRGVDAVIVTASTKSSDPIHQAARMCRKRGRIVLIGVTGLELSRADFYEKELSFQVSCSYGPGRYDASYEEKGQDYPVGFVRWTAQRNFEAVLDMMADKRLQPEPMISHRFAIDEAEAAYKLVVGSEPSLGIVLVYSEGKSAPRSVTVAESETVSKARGGNAARAIVGFIGAGNYATSMLAPAFKSTGARLKTVASSGGVSALHAARKFGFSQATTDANVVFTDAELNAVVIATRHNSHGRFVCEALAAGKNVFVEKPLAIGLEELTAIESAYADSGGKSLLMVGFNRRFAPQITKMKSLLAAVSSPKAFVMTVNAGAIPAEHWSQDPTVGGGRIVGEACHFIDLLRFLVGAPIGGHSASMMNGRIGDTATIQLSFTDGSIGTIHYFAGGNRAFPKERLEVFTSGRVLQLNNFRSLEGFGWPGFRRMRLWRQDKGQKACVAAFVDAIEQRGASPIGFPELIEVSRVSIEVADALR